MSTQRSPRAIGGPVRGTVSKTPDTGSPKAPGIFTALGVYGGPLKPFSAVAKAPAPSVNKGNAWTTALVLYGGPGTRWTPTTKRQVTARSFNMRKTLSRVGTRTGKRQQHKVH